jgi:hypothetical protein
LGWTDDSPRGQPDEERFFSLSLQFRL